jgi:hypothetical protein
MQRLNIILDEQDALSRDEMDFLIRMVEAHTDEEKLLEASRQEVEYLKKEGPVSILWEIASEISDPVERTKRQEMWLERARETVAMHTAKTRHRASCILTKLHVLKIAINY